MNVDPDGVVWVAVGKGEGQTGEVAAVRRRREALAVEHIPVGVEPRGVAGGEQNQWVVNLGERQRHPDRSRRPRGRPRSRARSRAGASDARDRDGATAGIWISNSGDGTVSRITALRRRGEHSSTAWARSPAGSSPTGTDVWVADQASDAALPDHARTPDHGCRQRRPSAGEVSPTIDLTKRAARSPGPSHAGFESIWITCGEPGHAGCGSTQSRARSRKPIEASGPTPRGYRRRGDNGVWVTSGGENDRRPWAPFKLHRPERALGRIG